MQRLSSVCGYCALRTVTASTKVRFMMFTDDDADRSAEDGATAAAGASSSQDRQVLRVRDGCSAAPHGHVCAHCALARLLVVSTRATGTMVNPPMSEPMTMWLDVAGTR